MSLHLVMTGTAGNVPCPNILDDFQKTSERCNKIMSSDVPQKFEHFRSYLKDNNFRVH